MNLNPHKILHRLTDPLHQRLVLKSRHYSRWHNYKHHKKVHIGVLVGYIAVVAVLIQQTLFPALSLASSGSWNFSSTGDYTYDNTKIDIAGNQAALKALSTGDGTGGTITHDGSYTVHTFTANDTFTPPTGLTSATILIVAGGGGGGQRIGGGGGAGGLIYNGSFALAPQAYAVVVGGGGAGAVSATTGNYGTSGQNSTFGTITAIGGGGGGYYNGGNLAGKPGGSGGGQGGTTAGSGGEATSGQGYNGGVVGGTYSGGGGGGAGAVGGTGATAGTNGGAGVSYSISGGSVCYAGGGGAGGGTGAGSATCGGGLGGSAGASASNATDNTGSGGGGARNASDQAGVLGGNGGSGVVIVRYLTTSYSVTHAIGSDWIATDTGNDWPYRKAITISKTNVSSMLNYFPIKVEISGDTDIGAHSKADMTDLRFTDHGGVTILPAEKESGAVTAGSASGIFWVQVPSISSTVDTVLYVYYGNSSAAAQANPQNVWGNNFAMIHHMSDATTSTVTDSKGAYNGTKWNPNVPNQVTGKVGKAQDFSGSWSMINFGNTTQLNSASKFTISFWMNSDTFSQGSMFAKYSSYPNDILVGNDASNMYFQVDNGTDGGGAFSDTGMSTGTWYYVECVYDGTQTDADPAIQNAKRMQIYLNGLPKTLAFGAYNVPATSYSTNIHTYAGYYGSMSFYDGRLDELRISSTARSADWSKFEYYNQADAAGQLSYGAQVGINDLSLSTPHSITNITAQSYNTVSGFSGATSGTGSTKFQVSPNNGTTWYWWNSSAWTTTTTGITESNTAADINTHFADSSFNSLGTNPKQFKWRSFFVSDGSQQPILSGVSLTFLFDTLAPPNPTLIPTSQKTGGTTITTGNYYNYSSPYFGWDAVTDVANAGETPSGVAGYYIYFGTDNTALPTAARGLATEVGGTGIHYQATTGFEVGVDSSAMTTGNTYYVRAQTKDVAGNISTAATLFTYKYDATAPNSPAYVSVSPSGYSRTNSYVFSWPVSGADGPSDPGVNPSGLLKYQYQLGTNGWVDVPGDSATSTISPTNPAYRTGANNFYLRSVDVAGNFDVTPTQVTFYYNNLTPTTPTSLAVNPSSSSSNSFAFSWSQPITFNGSISGYYYSVNALPTLVNSTFTASTSLSAAPFATQQGQNTFYIVAKDDAGNVDFDSCNSISGNPTTDGCAKVNFTANTSAPGIPTSLQAIDASNRNIPEYSDVLKWAAPVNQGTGFAGYSIERSTDNNSFAQVATSTGTAYVDDNLQSQLYYYRIRSLDNAGQSSAYSSTVSITPTGRYLSPPNLIDKVNSSATAFSAHITWLTDREGSTIIKFGKDKNNLDQESSHATELVKSHDITIKGLDPETTYYYEAIWIDSDGNQGRSDMLSFQTGLRPKIADVKISGIGLNTATISWTSTTISTSTVNYGLTGIYGMQAIDRSGSQTTKHSLNIDNLADSSTYHFQIVGTDTDGNLLASDDYSLQTLVRPVISNLRNEPVKDAPTTTLKFTYTTNTPTTTIVNYNPSSGISTLTKSDSRYVTDHSIEIPDLIDKSVYSFQASGVDEHGNSANSDKINYTTPEDTRPPKISNLSIEVKQQGVGNTQKAQIVATWTTDEPATSQVQYAKGISGNDYNNQTKEDTALSLYHAVIISELDPSTIYHLRTISADASGNKSTSSETTTITGKIQQSVIDIILNTLQRTLGGLFGFGGQK